MERIRNKRWQNLLALSITILAIMQCYIIYMIIKANFLTRNTWTFNSVTFDETLNGRVHVAKQKLWNSYLEFHQLFFTSFPDDIIVNTANANKVIINTSHEKLHIAKIEPNFPVKYKMNNDSQCKQDESTKLVVIVISQPSNFNIRSAIRGTWGFPSITRAIVFLICNTNDKRLQKELVEENNQHNDIVQGNFTNTDPNLTLQSIALLQWINSSCKNAEFILKVDDNNFVNIPNILHFLTKINSAGKLIIGRVLQNTDPLKDVKSPYSAYEPFHNISYSEYLDGSSYIICRGAIEDLLYVASAFKDYNNGGTFITGTCAEYSNTTRMNANQFNADSDIRNPCSFKNIFTTNVSSSEQLFSAWWYTVHNSLHSCE